jgi:hypothetical protein
LLAVPACMIGVLPETSGSMWLGLVVVTMVGMGLPGLAWWLTRRMASGQRPYSRARLDAFGVPMDAVDAWLADHTALPELRRWSVRQAAFGGRAADDLSLRPVIQQLAAALLAGDLNSDVGGWSGWALAAAGGAELIVAAVACLVAGHVVSWLIEPAVFGAAALTAGLIRPRLLRSRLERAVRLNT